jgi:glycosyltransferase involved in cell wall biosynthesis
MSSGQSISVFLPGLHGGGAEKMMLDLCNAFDDAGHRVYLVVAKKEGNFIDRVPADVDLVDLNSPEPPGFNLLGSLPGLIAHLRRRRPDAVLSALNRANIVAVLAARLSNSGTRVVVSEHNHLSTYLKHAMFRERALLPRLVYSIYPHADDIVAVSRGVAQDLESTVSLDQEEITVIHNPAMTPEVREMSTKPVDHPWFDTGEPVIIGLGNLTEQKDFPTLLRAVDHLQERRKCRLIICGEGEKRPELESLTTHLGIEDIVDLPGFVDNPYAMMNHADVFALSSKWEGFGNVVVEALGCGCPVVSTDCPSGPAEILDNGKYGTLVPVGDPMALADAIGTQIDNPPHSDRLRDRAADFSVENVAEEYLDVLLNR